MFPLIPILKKKGSIMRNSLPQSNMRKDSNHAIPMASSPFLAQVKNSAELSVLAVLGISGRILSRMNKQELTTLYGMLLSAMLAVQKKRSGIGRITSSIGMTDRKEPNI